MLDLCGTILEISCTSPPPSSMSTKVTILTVRAGGVHWDGGYLMVHKHMYYVKAYGDNVDGPEKLQKFFGLSSFWVDPSHLFESNNFFLDWTPITAIRTG